MVDFYYVTSNGNRIDFHSDGIWASENDLRNYEWGYKTYSKTLSGFQLKEFKSQIYALFYGYEDKSAIDIRHEVYEMFDGDVRSGKPGRLYIGDYYLDCYVFGTSSSKVSTTGRLIKTKFDVISADGTWKRENTLQFYANVESISDDGMDYPYDYAYDYTGVSSNASTISNRSFASSNFILRFFGPATNPSVMIAGHLYSVTGEILNGEYVVVDSSHQTVRKYAEDGSSISWFNNRYKEQSIFEKIPGGTSRLSWDGTCPFELVILEERSEPPFGELETDIPDGALMLDAFEYVLTGENDFIVLGG